jgi:hypothetical protein
MKKGKSQKERKAEAELKKAEKWWAALSDGEKRFAYELGKLARSLKAGMLASLVVNPENGTENTELVKKPFALWTKARIEGNGLN